MGTFMATTLSWATRSRYGSQPLMQRNRPRLKDLSLPTSGWFVTEDQVRARAPSNKGSRRASGLGRRALHAYLLGINHPIRGGHLEFRSELPSDLRRLRRELDAPGEFG
jgi:hypothetical protein